LRASSTWIGWSRLLVPETTEVGIDPHFEGFREIRLNDEALVFCPCEITTEMTDGSTVRRFRFGSESRRLMSRVGNIRSSGLLEEVELANDASVMERFIEIVTVFILIEDDRGRSRRVLGLDFISKLEIVEDRINEMGL
jgi:hypothetical protein